MPQEILNIIYSALGTIVTALVAWGSARLITWLNSRIKDDQVRKWMTAITTIITGAVQAVFQGFVETLKDNGKFDAKAQAEAKERALAIIDEQLTEELKKYIADNFGDVKKWISDQIETTIYQLKSK